MPLIYSPHDPRRTDSRLYKGGDGGAAQMREDEKVRQQKVQQAVDVINARFGIAPSASGGAPAAPDRSAFTIPGQARPVGGVAPSSDSDGSNGTWEQGPSSVDEAAYQKALAEFNGQQVDISGAKAAREAMYNDISGAVRDTAMRDLDRQYGNASKANKFGLARAGLLGGSADAVAGGELSTLYGEGKLKAEQQGLGAAAELRGTDEKTRQNLISLAQSGLDTGTAASLATGQMSAASELAKSQANTATVGNLFDGLSQSYLTNRVLGARYPNGLPQQQAPSGYASTVFSPSRYTGRATA